VTINPRLLEGVSREVRSLVRYLELSGVPHRVTTTTNHTTLTTAGNPSRHVAPGSDGLGLAIDIAGPTAGRDTEALAAIYRVLAVEAHALHELIYAGPQVTTNIKNGKVVAKYAQADHHNHVHVSVDKGVLLVPPAPIPPAQPSSRTLNVYIRLEDHMKTHDHVETLDQTGNAQWFSDLPFDKFLSVEACHPTRPYADGKYVPGLSAQPVEDDGKILVVITGGSPNGSARVLLTVADA
jgi:hypothetical protein